MFTYLLYLAASLSTVDWVFVLSEAAIVMRQIAARRTAKQCTAWPLLSRRWDYDISINMSRNNVRPVSLAAGGPAIKRSCRRCSNCCEVAGVVPSGDLMPSTGPAVVIPSSDFSLPVSTSGRRPIRRRLSYCAGAAWNRKLIPVSRQFCDVVEPRASCSETLWHIHWMFVSRPVALRESWGLGRI